MSRLRWRLVALLMWIAIFFNIERLDLDGRDTINLSTSVYVIGIVAMLAAMSPALSQRPIWYTAVPTTGAYLIYKLLSSTQLFGDAYTYLTFTGILMLLVTVVLAHRVGQELNAFVQAVEDLTFSSRGGRVRTMNDAEEAVQVEMSGSRRSQRPMSLVMIQLDPNGVRMMMHQLIQEIQRSMMQRYVLSTVARMMSRQLRRTDMIIEHDKPGRLVLLAPETSEDAAAAVGERMQRLVQERLGVTSHFATAAFPAQALTFEDLLNVAETRLHEEQPLLARSSEPEDRLLARVEKQAHEGAPAANARREAESARV